MAGTLFFLNKLGSIFLKHFNVTFTAISLTEIKFEGLNVTFHDKTHLFKRLVKRLKDVIPPVADGDDERLEMGSVMESVRRFFPRRGQPPPSLAESQDPPAQSVEDDHLVEFLIEAF